MPASSLRPIREPIKVVHFSNKLLTTVDPSHYGASPWTSREEVQKAVFPRAYFYEQGAKMSTEKFIVEHTQFGHSAVAKLAIYDFARDPLNIQDREIPWAQAEREIQRTGYQGFRHSTHYNSDMRGVIASWEPVKMERAWTMAPPHRVWEL